jgi:UvrD-like helicase family protein
MEVRAIGRRCATGAATVLGDIAQGTTPWAATSWPELLRHLGKPDAAVRELDVGYRVPRQILDYASRLLPSIAPGLAPARSLRADAAALSVVSVAGGELGARVAAGCTTALERPGSVAVICADAQVPEVSAALSAAGFAFTVLGAPEPTPPAATAPNIPDISEMSGDGRLAIVPVTLAKGLEFDHVVLVEPGRIATGEAYGLRRLYVALTRAVSRLTVFHAEPLPAELLLRTIKRADLLRPIPAFSPGALRGRRGSGTFEDRYAKSGETTISNGDVRWKPTAIMLRQPSTSTNWPRNLLTEASRPGSWRPRVGCRACTSRTRPRGRSRRASTPTGARTASGGSGGHGRSGSPSPTTWTRPPAPLPGSSRSRAPATSVCR